MKQLTDNCQRLITLLNDQAFHSGAELGKQLAISRSAVWKYIEQLQSLGIDISRHQTKGYQLNSPLYLLDTANIQASLAPEIRQHCQLELFSSIDSTNQYLIQHKLTAAPYHICLSEQQTAGKGRHQRQWHSPFGQNIYCSLRTKLQQDISELAGLSLVMSLAVIATLKIIGVSDVLVKWPNDIYWQQKKLSGILIEVEAEPHSAATVVIGIGININMQHNDAIDQPWTSLYQITQQYHNRNSIATHLINHVINYLNKFTRQGLTGFIDEWQHYDLLANKTVSLQWHNKQISGIARGIANNGQLRIEHNGEISNFAAGEVSISK